MKKLNQRFLLAFTLEQKQDFMAELVNKNMFNAKILLPVVLILTVLDIVRIVFFSTKSISALTGQLRLTYYLILFFVTAALGAYLLITYKRMLANVKPILLCIFLYCTFICFWSTIIIMAIPRGDAKSIALYFAIVIGVSVLSYLNPVQSISLFAVNHLLFVILFIAAYGGTADLHNSIVNTTVVAALAVVISLSRYGNVRRVFLDRAVILQKNREIEEVNHRLGILVHTDVLTGLNNRRFLDDYLPAIWKNAVTAQTPLAILMLDIDDFKCLNDHYGHHDGDKCLTKIARVMEECVDDGRDYVLRYGGEEFMIIMPEASAAQATQTAERIRASVEALGISNPPSPREKITISIGLYCAVPTEESTLKHYLRYADQALYQAKKAGKNRVEIYT